MSFVLKVREQPSSSQGRRDLDRASRGREGGFAPARLQNREFARAFAVAVAERRKEVTQTELISLN